MKYLTKSFVLGLLLVQISGILILNSCSKENDNHAETRLYRMGFQNSAPRSDFDLVLQTLYMWTERADAAIISAELPWDSLLAGIAPKDYIDRNYKNLVNFYRAKNFKLWVYLDPANGLNRGGESDVLIKLGKSITQPEVQMVFRNFALAADSILLPEHLGLVLETNLIRGLAPYSLYQAIKELANTTASDLRSSGSHAKLSVSVQVEWAWGKLDNTSYRGIEQDLTDFPFAAELGLSTYPYFAFDSPADIPSDYYSRLVEDARLPVFISESGWSSETVTSFEGTPQKQADYYLLQQKLLNTVDANGFFQLVFTDIDLSSLPPDVPSTISFFAFLGLTDTNLQPKPALNAWDRLFHKPLLENN